MDEFEFSDHATSMLAERNISKSWVYKALDNPDKMESHDDDTVHYMTLFAET